MLEEFAHARSLRWSPPLAATVTLGIAGPAGRRRRRRRGRPAVSRPLCARPADPAGQRRLGRRPAPAPPAARRPTTRTSRSSTTGPNWSPRSAATRPPTARTPPRRSSTSAARIDLRVDADDTAAATAPTSPTRRTRLDAFLAAYDPAVWGRATKPSGPLEDARARSAKRPGRHGEDQRRQQHHDRRHQRRPARRTAAWCSPASAT